MSQGSDDEVDERLRPQVRLLLIAGAVGAVLLVTSLLVDLVWYADVDPSQLPQIPGLPTVFPTLPTLPEIPTQPALPTDLPAFPTDLPTNLPTGFPTELPSLPAFPGGDS